MFGAFEAVHNIARVAVEIIAGDDDVGGVLDVEIVLEPLPKRVASDGDAPRVFDVEVDLNIAENVVSNGHMSLLGRGVAGSLVHAGIGAPTDDANIGGIWRLAGVLEGAAGDGDFRDGAARGIEPNVCRRGPVLSVIALNIAAADLEVSNFAAFGDHTTATVVTDVAVCDVGLMEIDGVEKNADAAVVVNMAVCDQQVAVAVEEVEGVAGFPD